MELHSIVEVKEAAGQSKGQRLGFAHMRPLLKIVTHAALVVVAFAFAGVAQAQTGVVTFPIGTEDSGISGEAVLAGSVTDAQKALEVARPILISVYGKKQIQHEEPLIASRKGDIWFIEGSMHCPDQRTWWQKLLESKSMCFGGTAELKLSAKNGAVLIVTHYQ